MWWLSAWTRELQDQTSYEMFSYFHHLITMEMWYHKKTWEAFKVWLPVIVWSWGFSLKANTWLCCLAESYIPCSKGRTRKLFKRCNRPQAGLKDKINSDWIYLRVKCKQKLDANHRTWTHEVGISNNHETCAYMAYHIHGISEFWLQHSTSTP